MSSVLLAALSLLLQAPLAPGATAQGPADAPCVEKAASPTVAVCGERELSLAEVDAAIEGSAEVLRETLERSRRERLHDVVATRVVQLESARRAITVEALMQAEGIASVRLPTVDEARAFYDEHRDRLPGGFGAHRATILEQMAKARRRLAFDELVGRLHVRHGTRWPHEALDLGDPSLAPSTALAAIGAATVTLGDVDLELHPLPLLVEDEIYELRRVEIERRLEEWSSASAGARVEVLLAPPRSLDARLARSGEPSLGRDDAPVTIVAFVDFQCTNCAHVHGLLTALAAERPDVVRLVLRDFPLTDHELAVPAAIAAEAAREQGRYWDYSRLLFERQPALAAGDLRRYAQELGLDLPRFDAASRSPELRERVDLDRSDGIATGVFSTPTVFVNGRRVIERERAGLERAIEQAARERAATSKRPNGE